MSKNHNKSLHLSKSRMMQGLQCEKMLYLTVHRPDLAAPPSPSQQRRFDNGHIVGEHAQRAFPGGVLIDANYKDVAAGVKQTKAAMDGGADTIYEATFEKDGLVAKVDILHREQGKPWKLIEVKSATKVKDEYIQDAAFQQYVLQSVGVKTEKAFILHLNNECEAPALENLFIQVDVTDLVVKESANVVAKIIEFQNLISQDTTPEKKIGTHCNDPYECPFMKHCWSPVPSPSIFDVPGLYKEKWEFYYQGIVEISDQRFGPFGGNTAEHVKAHRTATRWVNVAGIRDALKDWEWPLVHLDFETIDFVVPKFNGTRSYQQLPFQFSCLVQEKPGVVTRSHSYLHDTDSDPREKLLPALLKALSEKGTIVSYSKSFEEGRLKELAKAFPTHADVLLSACQRMVDPLPLFRSFVYDPKFTSSFSIKSVAPAILGQEASYEKMEVGDGSAAQAAYLKLIAADISPEEKARLKQAMLEYCYKDTKVMMDLVDWLYAVSGAARQIS